MESPEYFDKEHLLSFSFKILSLPLEMFVTDYFNSFVDIFFIYERIQEIIVTIIIINIQDYFDSLEEINILLHYTSACWLKLVGFNRWFVYATVNY